MTLSEKINQYIESIAESKQTEMMQLHQRILQLRKNCELWFIDGKDENGKIVSNPSIGYGIQKWKYADGSIKDFYQIGISANQKEFRFILWDKRQNLFIQ